MTRIPPRRLLRLILSAALPAIVCTQWLLTYPNPYTTPRIGNPWDSSPVQPHAFPPIRFDLSKQEYWHNLPNSPFAPPSEPDPVPPPRLNQKPGWSSFSSHGTLFLRRVGQLGRSGFGAVPFSLSKQDRSLLLATHSTAIVYENGEAVDYDELAIPYPTLLALVLLPPLLITARRALRNRSSTTAAATHRCPTCNYDLRATPTRCPECGTPASLPL